MDDLPPASPPALSPNIVLGPSQPPSTNTLPPHIPTQKLPNKSRMVVVDTLYHQAPGNEPAVTDSRFGRWLKTDEQPYGPRVVKAGPEWAKLDCGWLSESAAMLIIECREGEGVDLGIAEYDEPTEHCIAFAMVAKGESARFSPYNLPSLRIRAVGQAARYVITLTPE